MIIGKPRQSMHALFIFQPACAVPFIHRLIILLSSSFVLDFMLHKAKTDGHMSKVLSAKA